MAGWHHRLDGHGFGQALGEGEGQGGLACCSPCRQKELDTFKLLNNNNPLTPSFYIVTSHFFDIMKTIILVMTI